MTTTESPVNPPEPGAAPSVSDAGANADAIDPDTESDLFADALTPTPEQETATLRAALADANAEIARQQDAVQRGRADLANARRRHDEERIGIRQQANSALLVRLLPIVDELDLAVTHLETGGNGAVSGVGSGAGGVSVPGPGADPAAAAASWIEGVRLIQRKLASFLEGEGVTRIAALGETFNPERHEAVGMAQVDGAASGCIVEVVRQGYLLHDRVVQAAQVVVNR